MSELTNDELTVLMIAARGESMVPIGRWEQPIKSLNAKALLLCVNSVNYVITSAGRQALKDDDPGDALARALIAKHNQVVQMRNASCHSIEQAAAHLATAARETANITGDSLQQAARRWSAEVLRLALEKLDG